MRACAQPSRACLNEGADARCCQWCTVPLNTLPLPSIMGVCNLLWYPVMRHMCWHVHIAQVVVRHFALHPQVLSSLAHYLSVRCTCQDWERGFRKCWLTWSRWGNEVGTELYDRRIQSKCVVPQTCHCYHRGPNHAWTHPAGSSARTDFIAIDHIPLYESIRTWGHWRRRFVPDQTRSWMSDDWFTNLHVRKGGPSRDTNVHDHGAYLQSTCNGLSGIRNNPANHAKRIYPMKLGKQCAGSPVTSFCQMTRTAKQAVTCSVLVHGVQQTIMRPTFLPDCAW